MSQGWHKSNHTQSLDYQNVDIVVSSLLTWHEEKFSYKIYVSKLMKKATHLLKLQKYIYLRKGHINTTATQQVI